MKIEEFEIIIDTSISEIFELQKLIRLSNLKGINAILKEKPNEDYGVMAATDYTNILTIILSSTSTAIILKELFITIREHLKYKKQKTEVELKLKNGETLKFCTDDDEKVNKIIDRLMEK